MVVWPPPCKNSRHATDPYVIFERKVGHTNRVTVALITVQRIRHFCVSNAL